MSQAAAVEAIPLVADARGVLRVTGTNVTLDAVVKAYRVAGTPEVIAQQFPSLQLADIYAVLTFYLRHQEEVDTYLQHRKEETLQAVAQERSELLARKYRGRNLSVKEQDRLDALTARLKQLLPPVSADLESLLKMTEEVQQIREHARARRRHLGLR
jgi:uncharacterized protein (DUF433 family)